jgi:hypothetical protein
MNDTSFSRLPQGAAGPEVRRFVVAILAGVLVLTGRR